MKINIEEKENMIHIEFEIGRFGIVCTIIGFVIISMGISMALGLVHI